MSLKVTTPSDREIVTEREFNAPKKFVYDARTKPELVKRWLTGPAGWSFVTCEIDLRVGGKYRYRWQNDSDGTVFGMTGVFKEINANERIVHTEIFDEPPHAFDQPPPPGPTAPECLVTTLFVEKNGKTTLTITMRFDSKESRDAAVHSGMTDGMEASYARFERDVLPSLS
jgi:uncharacterized protein YndB with AHSA1/START domain